MFRKDQLSIIWAAVIYLCIRKFAEINCERAKVTKANHLQMPWFHITPNETLIGVPKGIVQQEKNYPVIKSALWSILGRPGNNAPSKPASRKRSGSKKSTKFPCNAEHARSMERPTSAHRVRPGDIDVIGAMGDSLSAANGAFARNLAQILVENRGVSFTSGGKGNWDTYLTLPNIIKEFNPNLIGYALGDASTFEYGSQFNVAEMGAFSQDMPYMAKELVKRIRNDSRVNVDNDWKLITMMIGSNDFCLDLCYQKNVTATSQMHRNHLLKTLQYLKDNLPRTIINIVLTPHLKILVELKVTPLCQFLKIGECPCLFATQHRPKRKFYYQIMSDWVRIEEEIAADERFRDKEDFTIILQPFTKNITGNPNPKYDPVTGECLTNLSYMSHDCFHFSTKGYATAANALWNNMMEPVGQKSLSWDEPYKKILCPTETQPYIYTWKNSHMSSNNHTMIL